MKCGLHCIRIWCADTIKYFFFNVSLTLHLSITLTNDQLDAQLFNMFIRILYMFRAISCSSSGGQIVLIQHLVSSLSVSDRPVHLCTGRSLTESDDTRCFIFLFFISNLIHCFFVYIQYLLSSFLYMFQASQAHHQEV